MKNITLSLTLVMLALGAFLFTTQPALAQGPTPTPTPAPTQAPTPAPTSAPATGALQGQVVNGTKDAPLTSTANVTVTLLYAPLNATAPLSATLRSDSGGRFTFSKLDTAPTTRYLLSATYQEIEYFSDVFAFTAGQTTQPITVTINETTTDPSFVRVNQTHFIIDLEPRLFSIGQIVVVENTGDRTFIGKPAAGPHRATLTLPILDGAQNVQFDRPDASATTIPSEGALSYGLPIYPGMDQIVYSYELPYNPPTYQFKLKMPYDSAQFRILIRDVGETVTSAQLSKTQPYPAQNGQNYLLSSATNVTAGTVVQATFANLPASAGDTQTPSTPTNDNSPMIAIALVAAAVIGAGALLAYPFISRRKTMRREELLQLLEDLDADFAAGEIDEHTYRHDRAVTKTELKKLGK